MRCPLFDKLKTKPGVVSHYNNPAPRIGVGTWSDVAWVLLGSSGAEQAVRVIVNCGVAIEAKVADRLADIPELARYACFADGHSHKAAVHDPRHDGSKMAGGHFYALNLRTHTLCHLAVGED